VNERGRIKVISIGDIVKFDGFDADCTGEVCSSYVDDEGVRWYWMESQTGMMAQFMESELIVVLKAQTPYERFNGKSKNFE
jgi:hypothetical protein